jgi:aminoglycoside phosphotransferase (APT) family kinase protein
MVIGLNNGIELASKIAAGVLDEAQFVVTPLVGKGSVNEVFIAAAAQHKLVVRMSDRAGALDEYSKEAWCIERAAERGVSVPAVMGPGRCCGHAYIVQSYIAGDEGRDSPVPKPHIWRELGRYAGLIHAIHVPGFGLKLSEIIGRGGRQLWLRHLEYNIESLSADDQLIKLGVLTPQQSRIFRAAFVGLRGREFTFGLNHGDLSLKNTIVAPHDGHVTLIDWGSAEAAIVPHHDLIQMLKMSMLEGDPDAEAIRAFLDGYGISPVEYERITPELETLLVLRAFDKLRWALDWHIKELDGFVSHARAAVSKYLT